MRHRVSPNERAVLISLALVVAGYFLGSKYLLAFAMIVAAVFLCAMVPAWFLNRTKEG